MAIGISSSFNEPGWGDLIGERRGKAIGWEEGVKECLDLVQFALDTNERVGEMPASTVLKALHSSMAKHLGHYPGDD